MLPEKGIKCHKTFARADGPIDCRTLVCEHGCRLWKRVTLEGDPNTPPGHAVKPVDHYDCVDSLVDLYMKDLLRRQLQTTATVDNLRQEVREGNDQTLVGTLARLNDKIDHAAEQALLPGSSPTKLLEN
jgi:hypothetical protein